MNNKEQQKAQAANDASKSLQMHNEDILEKIFYCANVPPPYKTETSEKRALAYFSSLLINLSRQAEKSTEKIIKLTKQLYYLTWFIAILAIITLLVGIFEFTEKSIISNLNPRQKNEQTQKNETPN